MEFPLHAQVMVKDGKYKGEYGVITQIHSGWYIGHSYTVQLDSQKVEVFRKQNLIFTKWDARL